MKNLVKNVVLTAFLISFMPLSFAQEKVEEVVVTVVGPGSKVRGWGGGLMGFNDL